MTCASRLAVIALLSTSALSCASDRQLLWGEETTTTSRSSAAAPIVAARLDARSYAERFPSDGACEAEARRIAANTPSLAIELVTACIERGAFRAINGLTRAPWTTALATSTAGPALCARVVAARAGDVEADVKACKVAGFKVNTLHEVMSGTVPAKGSLVIARVRADDEAASKNASNKRAGATLLETVPKQGEVESEPTGRRVIAQLAGHTSPRTDTIVLLLATRRSENGEGETVVYGDIVEFYATALIATF